MNTLGSLLRSEQDAIRCPYPIYARLREQGPVAYDAEHDVYVVTRHAEIEAVTNQPQLYSNRNPMGPYEPSYVMHGMTRLPVRLRG